MAIFTRWWDIIKSSKRASSDWHQWYWISQPRTRSFLLVCTQHLAVRLRLEMGSSLHVDKSQYNCKRGWLQSDRELERHGSDSPLYCFQLDSYLLTQPVLHFIVAFTTMSGPRDWGSSKLPRLQASKQRWHSILSHCSAAKNVQVVGESW